MSWQTTSHYFSGQGVVLLGARNTAVTPAAPAGLIEVGNVASLKINVSASTSEHKETSTGARAMDLRLTTELKVNVAISMENFIAKNLARALRGHSVTSAAGAVTDEPVLIYPGMIMPLPHIRVSSVVVKKGAATLELGVDYALNPEAGSIKWLKGNEGDSATVSYSFEAQEKTHALSKPMTDYWVRFEGLNTADENRPVVVDMFRLSSDPLKELDLIGDKVTEFMLEGSVLADLSQAGTTNESRFFTVKSLR